MEGKDEKSLIAEPGPCVDAECSGTAPSEAVSGSLGTECAGGTRLYVVLVCASPRNLLGIRELIEAGTVQGSSLDVS